VKRVTNSGVAAGKDKKSVLQIVKKVSKKNAHRQHRINLRGFHPGRGQKLEIQRPEGQGKTTWVYSHRMKMKVGRKGSLGYHSKGVRRWNRGVVVQVTLPDRRGARKG